VKKKKKIQTKNKRKEKVELQLAINQKKGELLEKKLGELLKVKKMLREAQKKAEVKKGEVKQKLKNDIIYCRSFFQ
jgi:hypothetical protein